MKTPERYVLDSFALLAYLGDEPGAETVEGILVRHRRGTADAWLSMINFGEVLYITERERGLQAVRQTVARLDELGLNMAVGDRGQTFAAAHIKARFVVSYADAFSIALARDIGGRIVTGDPEFATVADLIPVHWIGR